MTKGGTYLNMIGLTGIVAGRERVSRDHVADCRRVHTRRVPKDPQKECERKYIEIKNSKEMRKTETHAIGIDHDEILGHCVCGQELTK